MKIIKIDNRSDLKKFLAFPKKLYKDILKNDKYVVPLNLVTKITIGSYKSKSKGLFLAIDDQGEVIGRIATKEHSSNGETKLHFGFFECLPDNLEAATALFDAARDQNKTLEMIGPYSFRMEDPYMGLLIEGNDIDPYFMMQYNPKYYQAYFEAQNFDVAMDVLAYDVDASRTLPDDMLQRSLACEAKGFKLRTMNAKKMKAEVKIIARIFNDALSKNWGFEELIEEQVNEMYLMFKFFINPELVLFATKDGEDVGCLIMLPNFNPMIKQHNGRLTPSLLWKILTKRKSIDTARGYALGIKKEAHGNGIGSFLIWNTWDKCYNEAGIKYGEISWVLSNNNSMNNLTVQMDGKPNKKYRIYTQSPV